MEDSPIKVFPPAAVSVKVSFYVQSAQELAQTEEVIQALLMVAGKPRQGTYNAGIAELCNHLSRAPSFVIQSLRVNEYMASKPIARLWS